MFFVSKGKAILKFCKKKNGLFCNGFTVSWFVSFLVGDRRVDLLRCCIVYFFCSMLCFIMSYNGISLNSVRSCMFNHWFQVHGFNRKNLGSESGETLYFYLLRIDCMVNHFFGCQTNHGKEMQIKITNNEPNSCI